MEEDGGWYHPVRGADAFVRQIRVRARARTQAQTQPHGLRIRVSKRLLTIYVVLDVFTFVKSEYIAGNVNTKSLG
jgi:hypothetical protein